MLINEIKKELRTLREEKYQKFSSSLLPEVNNILGVRIPLLRKIAKNIVKNSLSKDYLSQNDDEFFELTMIEAMVIGFIELDFNKIKKFIEKINNWSICDTFCASLKRIKSNKDETKNFLEKYFSSDKEFELRFCYVILLNYFLDEPDYVFEKLSRFKSGEYYAQTGAGWLLSYCFIKDFKKTFDFIKNKKTDKNMLKKGIQKALESYQINDEQKKTLKEFKINYGL